MPSADGLSLVNGKNQWVPAVGNQGLTAQQKMGYQPSLDGLRAISVLMVIAYHLHVLDGSFWWFRGGFVGVEVFFVVSGYLITALLIEERAAVGRINFAQFWLRRARRLLPALGVVLAVAGLWAMAGDERVVRQLGNDSLWALLYVSNWWQILGDQSYFSGAPGLLRHLWSLAVEEQWYLVWPPVFAGLIALGRGKTRVVVVALVSAATASFASMAVVWQQPTFDSDFRQNLVYLGTPFRAGGLLIGALLAVTWMPWRSPSVSATAASAATATNGQRYRDVIGCAAVIALAIAGWTFDQSSGFLYRGGFVLVGLLSAVAIGVVVDPRARHLRGALSHPMVVALGRRSYGLYLWHWPVLAGPFANASSIVRLLGGALVTAVFSELCYRFVEIPIRGGALSRLFAARSHQGFPGRISIWSGVVVAVAVVATVTVRYATAPTIDAAAGGVAEEFELPALDPTSTDGGSTAASGAPQTDGSGRPRVGIGSTSVNTRTVASSSEAGESQSRTTVPLIPWADLTLPVSVVIVGDSQAHSLAANQPRGMGDWLRIEDGSVDGCGVFDNGKVVTKREGFGRNTAECQGWANRWAAAAKRSNAQIALVVIGAWDVFDLATPLGTLAFDTPAWDAHFRAQLQTGIDLLAYNGAHVALLEVACMRPVDARGAGVPALPERGEDDRVAHVNNLLSSIARANSRTTSVIKGPDEWCNDRAIATDLEYRWDGVHVHSSGAKLIYEAIAPTLLSIAAELR